MSKSQPEDSGVGGEPGAPQRGGASPCPPTGAQKICAREEEGLSSTQIDCSIGFHIIKRVYLLNLDA